MQELLLWLIGNGSKWDQDSLRRKESILDREFFSLAVQKKISHEEKSGRRLMSMRFEARRFLRSAVGNAIKRSAESKALATRKAPKLVLTTHVTDFWNFKCAIPTTLWLSNYIPFKWQVTFHKFYYFTV